MFKRVYIEIEPLIGDTIFFLPFLRYLSEQDGSVEFGPQVNSWVLPHIPFNAKFNPELTQDQADYIFLRDKVHLYLYYNNLNIHMTSGYFEYSGLPIPKDRTIQFCSTSNESIDIVVSPFASPFGSITNPNKIWQYNKWIELIDRLPYTSTKAVIGSKNDDYSWLNNKDVKIISGESLPAIVKLLKSCKLFVSIDSGPAQLANVLGIQNHVLLYPGPNNQTTNEFSLEYLISVNKNWPRVIDIPVQPVCDMCYKVLGEIPSE
jgi:Glycosyltransferase family 9 (heptosyltransferase)